MLLTKKQQEGLDIAIRRFKENQKYTIISGYAGTGKTTLVQHIITALGVKQEDVIYCAFTGKATLVLSNKGCKNTSTLHKLLYRARLNPRTGKFSFFPRTSLEYPYKIVVVDEVSMVSKEIWDLLKKHQTHVLALGDPGQLGPIKATDDSGLLKNPHIFLDEIMRQEEGNEIIKLSMEIRKGESLKTYAGQHIHIIEKNELVTGMLEWADQILCAKNNTRVGLNNQIRQIQQRGEDPEVGDKIICLRNYWDTISDNETPLVNGTIGWITDIRKYLHPALGKYVLELSFETEFGETYSNLLVDYKLIKENIPSLSKQEFFRFAKNPNTLSLIPKEFAYGYAVTTWKAQGSEWNNVLLFEEDFPYIETDHRRYLYTGATRASERLVVVKK